MTVDGSSGRPISSKADASASVVKDRIVGDELVKSADVEALSSIVVVTAATADSELVVSDGGS